jgi:hypothetical protein
VAPLWDATGTGTPTLPGAAARKFSSLGPDAAFARQPLLHFAQMTAANSGDPGRQGSDRTAGHPAKKPIDNRPDV